MIELRRRNSAKSAPSSRLPKGYQEVEYLESTGESYIVTHKLYSSIKKYELRTRFQITSRTNYGGVFNAGNLPSKFTFRLLQRGNAGDSGYYAVPNSLSKTANFSITTTHGFVNIADIVLKEGFFQINNEQYTANTIIGEESIDECYFELFRNTDNNAYYYCRCKMYKLELDEDGITCLNLIPCYRTSDRVAGMYDIVNDVFYVNQGTGEFLVGPDVGGGQSSILPQDYQLVDYILNDNNFCILDSGVVAKASIDIEIELKVLGSNSYLPAVFSAWYDNNYFTRTLFVKRGSPSDVGISYYYNETFKQINGLNTTTWNRYYLSKDGLFINGELAIPPFSNEPGGWVNPNGQTYKFFYFRYEERFLFFECRHIKISDNGVLIRDYYPCYRKEDMVAGFYDIVEGNFYTSAGTGKFIVGPDVIG